MRLAELSSALIEDMTRKLRRRAIAAVVIIICVIAAAIQAVSAARYALEPVVGEVGARLIIALAFLAIAGVSAGLLLWAERRHARDAPRVRAEEDPRAAIIAEAVSVGYTLGRDFMKASPNDAASPDTHLDGESPPEPGPRRSPADA